MFYLSKDLYILEWQDDITIEDGKGEIIILDEQEQKALRDYLNKKFSDQKENQT